MLRGAPHELPAFLCLLDDLFLLRRGDLAVLLHALLDPLLRAPPASLDLVKLDSLFQQALLSAFRDGRPATRRFVDALFVARRGAGACGWDVLEVGVRLEHPVSVVLSSALLLKYRRLFAQLLLLTVGLPAPPHQRTCRALDQAWVALGRSKSRAAQVALQRARSVQRAMKFFVASILSFLAVDVVEPAATAFEAELDSYTSIDALVRGVEDFVGGVFERSFLVADGLRTALVSAAHACLEFADFVTSQLQEELALVVFSLFQASTTKTR